MTRPTSEGFARQTLVSVQIFLCGLGHDVGRQSGCGRLLVPRESFQVIAHELFVEARLAAAGFVLIGGPETGGIGRQNFVDEDEFAIGQAKFEFGVGDDDAALESIFGGEGINLEAEFFGEFSDFFAGDFTGLFEGDIFVVTGFGFGRGGENWFGQLGGILQTGRQFDAADGTGFLVIFPTGTTEVTAHDTFDGERLGLFDDHAAATDLGGVFLEFRRQRIVRAGSEVVGDEIFGLVEPEVGDLGEDFAFARDAIGHVDVEGRNAIGCDKEEILAEVKDFADFAGFDFFNPGQFKFE